MKKQVLIIMVLAIISLSARGQTHQLMFQKMFRDTAGPSQGNCIIQTSDGGYAILKNRMYISCINYNTCLIKTDAQGTVLWSKYLSLYSGCASCDQPSYFTQTHDGGFIISGSISYTQPGEIYLMKIDSTGNEQWRRLFIFPLNNGPIAFGYSFSVQRTRGIPIRQMDDGGFIFEGVNYNSNDSLYSLIVIKTDSLGNTLWSKRFNSNYFTLNCHFELIGSGPSQGILCCADIKDSLTWKSKLLLSRISNTGMLVWSKMFSIYNKDISASFISKTTDNGFVITGANNYNSYYSQLLAMKIDSSGNSLWSWEYVSPNFNDCWGNTIKQTANGNYIIGGSIRGDTSLSKSNSFLFNIDHAGNIRWSKRYFGNNKFNYETNLTPSNDGGYAFCGCIYDSIPNNNNSYLYFVKTDSLGNAGCFDSTLTLTQHPLNLISYSTGNEILTVIGDSIGPILGEHDSLFITNICTDAGIENIFSNNNISIYPNPTTNLLTISLPATTTKSSILNLYDMMGEKVIETYTTKSTQSTIDLSNLKQGVYFLEVMMDGEKVVRKVVKL